MKVLFGMPLQETTGFVESLLRLAGLDWRVPNISTLCRRLKTLNVAIPYRDGLGPLQLSRVYRLSFDAPEQLVSGVFRCSRFLVHLRSIMAWMNQKSSLAQNPKSVWWVLTLDR